MNYIIIALLISFGTVLLPSLIQIMITKKQFNFTTHIIIAVVYFFITWLIIWYFGMGIISPLPLAGPILFGFAIGMIPSDFNLEDGDYRIPNVYLTIVTLVIMVVVWSYGSNMFHAKEKSELIGKVEVVSDFNSAFRPADPAHICLVSEDMAVVKSQTALSKFKLEEDIIPGSRFSIGEPTKQFVDNQLWWVFPLDFQNYFKWKQNKDIPGYLRVSAEDPKAEPQAVQTDKNGNPIMIRYSLSSCYEYEPKRLLRHNGYGKAIITDWTFEVNDEWKPYYTASIMERSWGYAGKVFIGIVLMDPQTGKFQFIEKDSLSLPEWNWIDRGIPLKNLDYQLGKFGKYAKCGYWYAFWHDDKSQETTDGWYLTYDNGKCSWFSGWTSSNPGDQALTGFSLSDGKTGKTVFYKANGVTERIAKKTAISLWKNFDGYRTTELVPYNIYGVITYVCPITYEGQFKGVSLVSMSNKDINAKGNNLGEVLSNYRSSLISGGGRYAPNGEESQIMSLDGIVFMVGKTLEMGQRQIFTFLLKGINKSFTCSYTDKTLEILYLQAGQSVSITYLDTKEAVIQIDKLDVHGIQFVDENPEQARLLENTKKAKIEINRVDKEEIKQTLLGSDAMKNVDSEELKKFLEKQKQK